MVNTPAIQSPEVSAGYAEHRADLMHYWARLIWYRDELWRITTPVWGVYGAFLASCIGYVWSMEKGRITSDNAFMLLCVIVSFSWVIQRMYWTYAHRVYEAITELNNEVQSREQYLYDKFLKNGRSSNYGRFRVYPRLNVIFSIVGISLMLACIFTVAAALNFDFQLAEKSFLVTLGVPFLCLWLITMFEFVLLRFKKHCEVCGTKVVSGVGAGSEVVLSDKVGAKLA